MTINKAINGLIGANIVFSHVTTTKALKFALLWVVVSGAFGLGCNKDKCDDEIDGGTDSTSMQPTLDAGAPAESDTGIETDSALLTDTESHTASSSESPEDSEVDTETDQENRQNLQDFAEVPDDIQVLRSEDHTRTVHPRDP